ncbi:hypothetical protein ACROYT_G004755 [Oculina patagonica]
MVSGKHLKGFEEVPSKEAGIVALHYLKTKSISDTTMTNLKAACKEFCIPFTKKSNKNAVLESIGRTVFEKGIVKRKNDKELISYDNLITTGTEMK